MNRKQKIQLLKDVSEGVRTAAAIIPGKIYVVFHRKENNTYVFTKPQKMEMNQQDFDDFLKRMKEEDRQKINVEPNQVIIVKYDVRV